MPSKKKKYNARFPAGRIKKIMQTDEEVGKVAQAVPIIISRTLELFVESLLTKAMQITSAKNAKTLSPSHMKQCILSESRFDFLKELVATLPDVTSCDVEDGNIPAIAPPQLTNHAVASVECASLSSRRQSEGTSRSYTTPPPAVPPEDTSPVPLRMNPNFYKECDDTTPTRSSVVCALNRDVALRGQSSPAVQSGEMSITIDEDYDTT